MFVHHSDDDDKIKHEKKTVCVSRNLRQELRFLKKKLTEYVCGYV